MAVRKQSEAALEGLPAWLHPGSSIGYWRTTGHQMVPSSVTTKSVRRVTKTLIVLSDGMRLPRGDAHSDTRRLTLHSKDTWSAAASTELAPVDHPDYLAAVERAVRARLARKVRDAFGAWCAQDAGGDTGSARALIAATQAWIDHQERTL